MGDMNTGVHPFTVFDGVKLLMSEREALAKIIALEGDKKIEIQFTEDPPWPANT
jgi:hypothetical protein